MIDPKTPKSRPVSLAAEQIRLVPHMREMDGMRRLMKVARLVRPVLRPALKLMGKNVEGFDRTMVQLGEWEAQAADLTTIPDRFNMAFSDRGWIMYEMLNFDVAKAAVLRAEAGDVDGAEDDLVTYYDPETMRWKLRMMGGVAAFSSRMDLAEKALVDYGEGRYYSSVMVVLALLDGLVNELHEKQRGFFVTGAEVEAVDSISAHSTGLQKLSSLMGKARKTTRVEPMRIPFRHGIMHGMDLGFDNKMVAAKAWAALLAIREWAVRAESGTLNAQKKQEDKTPFVEKLRKFVDSNRRNDELKQQLDEWKPRIIVFGHDVPSCGPPDAYDASTPERKLVDFLSYWKRGNYGEMAKLIPRSSLIDKSVTKTAKEVRLSYKGIALVAYSLKSVRDRAAAISEIDVQLSVEDSDGLKDKTVVFRMVFEDADGHGTVRSSSGGCWVVSSWYAGST